MDKKVIKLESRRNKTPNQPRDDDREAISRVIEFNKNQPSKTVEEVLARLSGTENYPPTTRKWIHYYTEMDGDVLYYLDEQAYNCGQLDAIQQKAFSGAEKYKNVRKLLDKLNAQEFLNHLKQIKRKDKFTKCSPAQIQAIQDELDERRI